MRRVDLSPHAQYVVVIPNERFVILQGERHVHFPGITAALDQCLPTPTPDFLLGKFRVHDWPIPFGNVVGRQLRMPGNPPPAEEHSQTLCAEVCSHADQLPHKTDLSFTYLRNRIAEIVVRGDSENVDTFTG